MSLQWLKVMLKVELDETRRKGNEDSKWSKRKTIVNWIVGVSISRKLKRNILQRVN